MATGQQWLFAHAKPLVERLGKGFLSQVPAQPGVYFMCDRIFHPRHHEFTE